MTVDEVNYYCFPPRHIGSLMDHVMKETLIGLCFAQKKQSIDEELTVPPGGGRFSYPRNSFRVKAVLWRENKQQTSEYWLLIAEHSLLTLLNSISIYTFQIAIVNPFSAVLGWYPRCSHGMISLVYSHGMRVYDPGMRVYSPICSYIEWPRIFFWSPNWMQHCELWNQGRSTELDWWGQRQPELVLKERCWWHAAPCARLFCTVLGNKS